MSEKVATPVSGASGTSQSAKPLEPDADSPVGDLSVGDETEMGPYSASDTAYGGAAS